MRSTLALTTALLVLSLAACSGGDQPDSDVSERERLEAVGNSGLPGAQGINRALDAQDAANARVQAHDTIR
jgi:hypothetical protein